VEQDPRFGEREEDLMVYIKLYYGFLLPAAVLFVLCPFIVFPTGFPYIPLRRPYVTYTLLALLVLAGGMQFLAGPFFLEIQSKDWIESFAFSGDWDEPWRLWTCALCHHNELEFVAALVMLIYFGPPLEDRLKWHRMLAFTLFGGVAAPLLYLVLREALNLQAGAFYGFSIPLTFLLGVFFVLMPWSDLRIRYFFWALYIFPVNGVLGLASFFVIAGYLLFEINVVLPDVAPTGLMGLTMNTLLLLVNGLLGFLVGVLCFGLKQILRGEAPNSQDEGRLQRSLQRAIQKEAGEQVETAAASHAGLPPALAGEEKPEATVVPPLPPAATAFPPDSAPLSPAASVFPPDSALLPPATPLRPESSPLQPVSQPMPPSPQPFSPTAGRFSALQTDRSQSPGPSPLSVRPAKDEKPVFGLRPLGEDFSFGPFSENEERRRNPSSESKPPPQ
jgi:membrane associated rhomboid family serine protease